MPSRGQSERSTCGRRPRRTWTRARASSESPSVRAGAPGAPLKKQHGTWDSRWHSREAQTRVQRVARSQAPTSEREPQLWVVRGATEERASANLHRAPCPLAFESPSPCVAQRRGSSSTQNQSPRTSSSSDQVLNVECVSPHDHQAISPSSRPTRPLHLAWLVGCAAH